MVKFLKKKYINEGKKIELDKTRYAKHIHTFFMNAVNSYHEK